MSTTFPIIGHGPPKVSDDLHLWLIAQDEPDESSAQKALDAIPPALKDWIQPSETSYGGSLKWHGRILHFYSGYGLKYYVQGLDEDHLAWIKPNETLSEKDIDRILNDVLDESGKNPKNPKDKAWQNFGEQLNTWMSYVHTHVPLYFVVVGRKVKEPPSARHRAAVSWAQSNLPEVSQLAQKLHQHYGSSYPLLGWTQALVAGFLEATPAKKVSAEQRSNLLRCIDGAGLAGDAEGTKLLNACAKKEKIRLLAELLREGHNLGLLWLSGPSMHGLLLNDEVFDAAKAATRGMMTPYVVDQAFKRYGKPKAGVDTKLWLQRFIEVARPFQDEYLLRPAQMQPDNKLDKAYCAEWESLQRLAAE